MGILDYYKQFEALTEEEVNSELRAANAERKAKELTKVQPLDLSHTTWPEPAHPDVVSAVTFVARRGMHRYPRGSELISELAFKHKVPKEQIALGNGASQLLQAAASALMRPGQALLSPWPSHPLLPKIARRAHGVAVPVDGGVDELLAAAEEHDTRVIALVSPNDPTGELLATADLQRLLSSLPNTVAVLLDEALIEYSHSQPIDSSIALLEQHPRLLVFRSFSKAWGLAGLRCGYVVSGPGAESMIAELTPENGVSDLAQAGALETLRACEGVVARRVKTVAQQRERLTHELQDRDFQVTRSDANFLWVAHPRLTGGELLARLRDSHILVAPGAPLGDPKHVRITIKDEPASNRLLSAIDALS